MHGKGRSLPGDLYIVGGVIPLAAVYTVGNMVLVDLMIPDELIVVIKEDRAVRDSVGYLEFGFNDINGNNNKIENNNEFFKNQNN